MEGLPLKVSLFQPDADFSSWHHTPVAAVPVVAPCGRRANRDNHRRIDSCNRDNRKQVQDASVPGSAVQHDGSSRVEVSLYVAYVQVWRVLLPVA